MKRTIARLALIGAALFAVGTAFAQVKAGQKLFVAAGNPSAVGGDKQGMIGVSKDGVAWSLTSLSDEDESMENTPLSGVAWGDDRVVAVGGTKIIVSDDLKNWRVADNYPDFSSSLVSVAYGAGIFVAVGGTSAVAFSEDGLSWTRLKDKKGISPTLNPELDFGKTHLYGVYFHDGKFYALGNGNTITVLVPGGDMGLTIESSVMKGQVTSRLNDMVVANGTGVAVGTVEDYITVDFQKWKKIQPWQQYFAITHGAGKFVAVTGFGSVFSSPTGESETWKEASSAKLTRNAYFSVAFGNSVFVAGGNEAVSTSKDALSWKQGSAKMRFKKIIYIP